MRHVSLATDQSLTFHVPLASVATAWHFNVRRFGCHSDISRGSYQQEISPDCSNFSVPHDVTVTSAVVISNVKEYR